VQIEILTKLKKEGKMYLDKYRIFAYCIVCKGDIETDQKLVLVYKDEITEGWVHAGRCWEFYKKLLHSPNETEKGSIIGICYDCGRPVRAKEKFEIYNRDIPGRRISGKLCRTTFPLKKNGHMMSFFHKKCVR